MNTTDQPTPQGANARLIAAAPELLAALKLAVDRLELTDTDPLIGIETKALAWSAIAKAEDRQ